MQTIYNLHSMNDTNSIFNRRLVQKHRARASDHFAQHDFFLQRMVGMLAERLEETTRHFDTVLMLGAHSGQFDADIKRAARATTLIHADASPAMARQCPSPAISCDEEWLPFAQHSLDAILCPWGLHWVNDMVGSLIQMRQALKPDGLLLAMLPGAHSLQELRDILTDAELQLYSGVSARIAPFVDVRDAGNLLQRAGFALPVVDSDMLTITYPTMRNMLHDLRGMGETNALNETPRPLTRSLLKTAEELYHARYKLEDNSLPLSVEVVACTAWAPDSSQPTPAKRGSGEVDMEQFFSQLN